MSVKRLFSSMKNMHGFKEPSREAPQVSHLNASPHLSERHDGTFERNVIRTVALAIAVLFIWSSVTPVYEVVSGEGTIKPQGLSTRVEHLDGGIVTEIAVKDGDVVEPGELILQLDTQITRSELAKIDTLLEQAESSIERFETVIAIDSDTLNIPTLKELTSGAILSEIDYRLSQIHSIRSQQTVAKTEQWAIRANVASLRKELAIQQAQFERYQRLGESGSVSLNRREELQRENLRLQSNIARLLGEVNILDAEVIRLQSNEMELIAQFRRDAALNLDEKRAEYDSLVETRNALMFQIQRSRISSPVKGIIKSITVQNLGEVVQPGEVIVEIIPVTERTFAEIEIAADRIGGVSIGSSASVKILTYDFTRYGDLEAVVEHISPSSFQKDDGQTVFRVRLGFQNPTGTKSGPISGNRKLSPGMTVVADIKSEGRTILSFFLKPLRVISDRALTEA